MPYANRPKIGQYRNKQLQTTLSIKQKDEKDFIALRKKLNEHGLSLGDFVVHAFRADDTDDCDRRFKSQKELDIHTRKHRGEKP